MTGNINPLMFCKLRFPYMCIIFNVIDLKVRIGLKLVRFVIHIVWGYFGVSSLNNLWTLQLQKRITITQTTTLRFNLHFSPLYINFLNANTNNLYNTTGVWTYIAFSLEYPMLMLPFNTVYATQVKWCNRQHSKKNMQFT